MSEYVVAGGGISGLAAALAAAGAGHRVRVLERGAGFAELGAGIQLAPNAFRALDRLGVGAAVRARAVPVDELRLRDGQSGRTLTHLPLGRRYQHRFGDLYAVVHRGDLYAPLLEACREHPLIELRAGATVVGYRRTAAGVGCHLADGGRIDADALLGADGIRSAVRRSVVGDGAPRVSGHTIYRAVVPMDGVPERYRRNAVVLWAGPGWHFVHYPIAGGELLNMAITEDDGARSVVSGTPADRAAVLGRFPGLAPDAAALLELGENWRTWVLCDRDPVPVWSDGPVLLVGDAAHPMLQYAAQGACQALEDAAVLADVLLDRTAPPAAAFSRFTELRRERTARAQQVARWMGDEIFHPAGPAARDRDATLAALSTDDVYDVVSWLHSGWDLVPANA